MRFTNLKMRALALAASAMLAARGYEVIAVCGKSAATG